MTPEIRRRRSRIVELQRYLRDDRWNWLIIALGFLAVLSWSFTWVYNGSMEAAGKALGGFWGLTEPISGLATLAAVFASWFATVLKNMESEGEVRIVIRHGTS